MAKRSLPFLSFISCLPFAMLLGGHSDESPTVLVLAGQSNMEGKGDRSALDVSLKTLPPNVELLVEGNADALSTLNSFGPEVALAHELAAAMPHRRFKLLKFTVGGTSIRAWSPEWSEEAAKVTENDAVGALYPRLLAFLRKNLGERDAPPHAILWFQGERDSRYAAAAEDYGPRLDQLIQRLRSDLHAPACWIILGIVNSPYPHTAKVAIAQREAPHRTTRIKLIASDDLTKLSDSLHYDTAGQLELGRRYAQEILSTLPTDRTKMTASEK